jgi:hypothetical protein
MLLYDVFQSLWRHKTTWNKERPATVSTVMMKFFLSLNLLGSEYYDEISQERHKSMTLKCGCVTPAAEASTR